jgi:hypothetical protein
LVSHNSYFELGNWWTEIEDYVDSGGKVVIETFDIDGSNSEATTLWNTLGVSYVSDMGIPQSLYRWQPGHAIFTQVETVPDMATCYDDYVDDGDKCDPTASNVIAGFTASQSAGQGGLFTGSIVNSFIISDFDGDDDSDGKLDAVELWKNEISCISGGTSHYTAEIVVNSNDPNKSRVIVPVNLTILGGGSDEIGIWRGATRYFYLDVDGNGVYNGAATERFGPFLSSTDATDRPIAGDWIGGDGDETGIWRGATRYFYLDVNGNGVYDGAATERLGPFLSSTDPSDVPVAGDWDGDSDDQIGIWRGATRYFYLDVNGNGTYDGSATERFGPFLSSTDASDVPVAGNWDGL